MVRTTNRYDLINPAVVSFDEDDDDNDYDYDNENENDDELIYSTFDEYVVDFDASSFSSSEENDDAVITEEFDGQEELLDVDDTSSTDEIDVITEELGQELLDVLTNLSDDDDGGGGDCFNNNTMGATHTDEEKNPINISIQVSDIVHEYDEIDIELMKEGLSLLIDDDNEMVDADDVEDDEDFMAGFLGTATTTTTTTATTTGVYPSLVPQVTFDEDEDVRTPSTPSPWLNGQLTSYYVTAASSRGTTYTTSSKNDKANGATRHQHWSQQEDEKLKIEVIIFKQKGSSAGNNINWEIISNSLPSRSAIQCKCRWNKYLQPTKHYGKWEKYEDECILTMKRKGYMWADIASRLERRTGDYIRDRYVNYLDPNIKKTTWTEGEDQILFKYQRILGNKWSEIQKLLPGPGIRPQNSIKNRYNNRVKAQNRRLKVKLAFKSN